MMGSSLSIMIMLIVVDRRRIVFVGRLAILLIVLRFKLLPCRIMLPILRLILVH